MALSLIQNEPSRTTDRRSKRIVLIGAGHSHVEVLRQFGLKKTTGIELTLVTKSALTPYSGMLPGYLASHYTTDEMSIPTEPLARFANCRLLIAEATRLDPGQRCVYLQDGRTIVGDVISIDTGAISNIAFSQAGPFAIPVKPIDHFVTNWPMLVEQMQRCPGLKIAVVGAGAAGVELALSIQYHLGKIASGKGCRAGSVVLLEKGERILTGFSDHVRRRLSRILLRHNVEVFTGVGDLASHASAGTPFDLSQYAMTIWSSGVRPADWLRKSGLALDDDGFIAVNSKLQSTSHAHIFATGDAASMIASPRPKSGVIAVRQGPVLAKNLRRAVTGETLVSFSPQKHWLSLISTGERYAVAARGNWSAEGRWVWHWKDWIDRRFVKRYVRHG